MYVGVELLGHMKILCFTFCGTVWHHLQPAMCERSNLFNSLPIMIFHIFDYSRLCGCAVVSRCGLDAERVFMCALCVYAGNA